MVDANENDETSKLNLSPQNDADQSVIAPSTLLSRSNKNIENTVVNMEEYEDEEEEDDEYEDEEYEDEEEEEECEDEDELEEEGEEEMVNNGGRAMVVVNNGQLNVDAEHNKGKAIVEEESNKKNAVKEDAIRGEDKEKAKEPKNGKELGENSKGKGRTPKNKNRMKVALKASGTVTADGDKAESSRKKNASKRVESMGMVFMCSSKTKTDCFRYKILGLPANKKDQVAKIYKGMRLFLFDVDLRLMYGIFKAAGPGGYNLEPKAFKSEFPSQVRFTVLEDCLPLAEEKFRDVIKENYYTRNKFEGLLKAEQVKKLCKLFVLPGRGGARPRAAVKPRRTGVVENRPRTGGGARPRTGVVENRRVRADESRRSRADDARATIERKKRKRRPREEERRPRSPSGREKRRHADYERPPILYEREREAPVPRYLPPPSVASPVRSYGYERALELLPYERDRVPEHRTYRVLDVEARHRDEILSRDRDRDWDLDRDPYLVYSREAPPYRDTVYTLPPEYRLVSRDYHRPAVEPPSEYRLPGGSRVPSYRDVGLESDYRSSAASLPEYRSHQTHYRY